jgi:iron-sulfur cluster protein/radical SAM family protein
VSVLQWLSRAAGTAEWKPPDRFSELELQICSMCNRSCSFCPANTFPTARAFMSDTTIDRIVSEMEKIGFSGRVGLHLMCEPLLNKKFADILKVFRLRLPGVYLRIESNGDPLKDFSKLATYFDAGLNEILVNCYDSPEQFEARNGRILELVRHRPDIWYKNQHLGSPKHLPRREWKVVRLRDFHRRDLVLRNWAGHVPTRRKDAPVFPLALPCERPFQRIHVNYLGQVVLCNNDWKSEVIFGDFNHQTLEEILSSPVRMQYCASLARANRDLHLCRTCDNWLPIDTPPEPPVGLAARTKWPFMAAKNFSKRQVRAAIRATAKRFGSGR